MRGVSHSLDVAETATGISFRPSMSNRRDRFDPMQVSHDCRSPFRRVDFGVLLDGVLVGGVSVNEGHRVDDMNALVVIVGQDFAARLSQVSL